MLSLKKYFIKNKIKDKEYFFLKDILRNSNYEVGDFTYGNPRILEWGEGANLKIGKFCSIAENVNLFLGGNHRADWISTYPFNKISTFNIQSENIVGHPSTKGDIIIGHDVWIGFGSTILSGVNIGSGAIIGAFSLVTKNVLPYEIVAGNPARHIRFRFDEIIINKLMRIEWWNLEDEEIIRISTLLTSSRFDELFNYFK
jgi:acetyltransferase-like isoleucine patch superfamily enzyme